VTDEKLLTPEEVAERLRISRWTVMDYLREGRIKGRKIGRLWRITEEDLQAFVEGQVVAMAKKGEEPLQAINQDIELRP
jgi:excisionase family DNA binding protein